MVLVVFVTPWPRQTLQGFEIIVPSPPQVGQVCSTAKNPCWRRMDPAPLQVGQVVGWLPGSAPLPLQAVQVSVVGTFKDFFEALVRFF